MMLSRRLLEPCSFSSKPGRDVAGRICSYKSLVNSDNVGLRFFFWWSLNTFVKYLRVPNAVPHDLFPVFVNSLEKTSLFWNLLHDVLRGEDWLQVQPLGLHLQPLIYGFLNTKQTLLPLLKSYKKTVKTLQCCTFIIILS